VEAAISAAIKPGFLRLDLAKRTTQAMECAYGPEQPGNPDSKLACVCARSRLPPPSPEKVAGLLLTAKKFTNASDVSKVAQLYATFFDSITQAESLVFRGLKWGSMDVAELCSVLPRFTRLTLLDLSQNMVGTEGGKALAEILKVNGSLTSIDLSHNVMGSEGAKALAPAIAANGSLTSLDMRRNEILQ
jgi:hypothetical protein